MARLGKLRWRNRLKCDGEIGCFYSSANKNRQVRFLAARISEALDEAGALEAETAALLEGDETYACLLTVPGIGPRTAAQLAVSVDIC